MNDIDYAIDQFVTKCRELVQADGRKELGYDLVRGGGRKYIKIIMLTSNQQSSWCFVNYENGDIYKCGGWKAPDPRKIPRGNVYDPYDGMRNINWTGPAYASHLRDTT